MRYMRIIYRSHPNFALASRQSRASCKRRKRYCKREREEQAGQGKEIYEMTNSLSRGTFACLARACLALFYNSTSVLILSVPFSVHHYCKDPVCVRLCRCRMGSLRVIIPLLRGTENEDRDQDRGRECSEPVRCPFFLSEFGSWSPWGFSVSIQHCQPQTITNRLSI
jgi:hypothetical protein